MDKRKSIDIKKIILFILAIAIVVPSTINIFKISIFKIFTVSVGIIYIYISLKNKKDISSIIKNKFIQFNIAFAIIIFICLLYNSKNIFSNDIYEGLKYIIFALITGIIIIICKEKKYYIYLLKTISIVLMIVAIFGIIQYFNPFSINEKYIYSLAPTQYKTLVNGYENPRIVATKSNPSVCGFIMAVGVYFNLLYWKYARNKMLCIASIGLCIIALMLTLTRTIQIAFIVSIIIYIIVNVFLKKGLKKGFLAGIITIIIILTIILLLPDSLTWRITQVFNLSNTTSWIGRVRKWDGYIEIIKENILLGIGPVKNKISELDYIDSELIQNVLQYGIIGFTAYILMLISPIVIYRKDKNTKILKYYLPILAIILINNVASTSLILFDTAIAIYMIVGLILVQNKE